MVLDGKPSGTAIFVAQLRGSCLWLPKPCQLVEDPFAFGLVPGTLWERMLKLAPALGRWLLRPGSVAHKAVRGRPGPNQLALVSFFRTY